MNVFTNFLKNNSTTILSVAGCFGVAATGYLAYKTYPKAQEIIEKYRRADYDFTAKRQAIDYAKTFGPPIVVGGVSILSIIFANKLSIKTKATLLAALAATEEMYRNFQKETNIEFGNEATNTINTNIAKKSIPDKIDSNCQLYYEETSKRFFESTPLKVTEAILHINRNLQLKSNILLNEYYDFLGLDHTDRGDLFSWDICWFDEQGLAPIIDFTQEKVNENEDDEFTIIRPVFDPVLYPYENDDETIVEHCANTNCLECDQKYCK